MLQNVHNPIHVGLCQNNGINNVVSEQWDQQGCIKQGDRQGYMKTMGPARLCQNNEDNHD